MKKFQKIAALALASVMTLGLAACGPGSPTTQAPGTDPVTEAPEMTDAPETTDAPESTTEAPDTTDAPVTTDEPEGTEPEETEPEEPGEVVTLKWIAVGNGMPENYDAWKANINEYLEEQIGVNIEMEIIPWGDWDNRRNVLVSTSTDWDILFTNGGTYYNDVQINAFADITELVQSASPELYNMIPENYWEATKIDGKIYSVPTYKDSSQTEYFVWDVAVAEAAGVDPSGIDSWETLEPALETITNHLGEPAFPMNSNGASYLTFTYDPLGIGDGAFGVRYDDAEGKVVSIYEQDDVMDGLKYLHSFYNAGYINSDAATRAEDQSYKPVSVAQGWPSAAITTWGPNMGVEAVAYQFGPTVVSNETVRGSLNAISSSSEHPEKALEFLQLVNTDTKVRDALFYGLEGDNFEYAEDGRVHRNNTDWTMAGYTQGTFFNVTQLDDVDFNQWDEVKELNENAEPSVLLGFTFLPDAVSDQIANVQEIVKRYKSELLTGTVNPETAVPQMMDELRAAGFDDIIAEAQSQVDEFLAN